METLSHNDLLALNRTIGEIYSARDVEMFYRSVFTSVLNMVPYDHCSFNDTYFSPTRILKSIPSSQDRDSVIKKNLPTLNTYIHQHPLIQHFNSNKVVKTTDFASRNQFLATDIYNEYYRHLDTETQIGFSIPISPETVSIIALSRKNIDFSERDRLVLTLLKPHMAIALRNVIELGGIRLERDLLQKGTQGQGAIQFQSDGMVLCISLIAKEMLIKYFDTNLKEGDNLPGILWQWVTTETNQPENKRGLARVSWSVERVPLTIVKEGMTLKIKLIKDVSTADYILAMTETSNTMILQNLHGYGLSKRESEIYLWLTRGKTNAEIAIILAMSKRTVEKHLERVFNKLGVVTRGAAASILRND